MEKTIILIICISFLILIGCKEEKGYTLFKGKVENISEPSILTIDGFGYKQKMDILEDGHFGDTLRIPENGIYEYSIEKGPARRLIFLAKNTSLEMSFDLKDYQDTDRLNTVFLGETSRENNYLRDKGNFLREKIWKKVYDDDRIYLLKEQEYINALNDIKTHLTHLLDLSETSPEFQKIENEALKYDYIWQMESYEFLHGVYTGDRNYEVSDTFPEVTYPAYDEWAYKNSNNYRELIGKKLRDKANQLTKSGKHRTLSYLDVFMGIPNQFIKNDVLKGFSTGVIAPNEHLKTVFDFYMEHSSNEADKKEYQKLYDKMKAITVGSISPSFEYENISGETTSLEDLRGNFVYIDVWATWCGPCKAQIPYLKELKKEFDKDDIVFVGISIDKKENRDKWKKMVEEKEIGGVQLIADKDFDSDFIKKYNILAIPRFILLDPDGRIISNSATRPSEPRLKKQLISLLKK